MAVAKHHEFMVKLDEWGQDKNCTLFMWNNVPSGDADGPKPNPKQTGNVCLEIQFRGTLNVNITILVWGEFESVIYIDHLRAVQYDTSVQRGRALSWTMELVALSDRQLRALALSDPELKRVFQGAYPSDRLTEHPPKTTQGAYIVNMDPAGEPGQHWLGVWTEEGVCEVMHSYGLPLTVYEAPGFHEWIARHWKYVVHSEKTRQAYDSQACGHYAFVYLQKRVRRRSLLDFVETFRDGDYVWNDHRVGERVRTWIRNKLGEAALDEADGRDAQRCVSRRCLFPSLNES